MQHSTQAQKTGLIQNEISAAQGLLTILNDEFEALSHTITPEEIVRFTTQKEQLISKMESATKARISAIAATDPLLSTEPLKSLWERLRKVALECQQQNQINGRIITSSKRHIEQAAAILHGKPPSSELHYGSAGETVVETARHSIAKA